MYLSFIHLSGSAKLPNANLKLLLEVLGGGVWGGGEDKQKMITAFATSRLLSTLNGS